MKGQQVFASAPSHLPDFQRYSSDGIGTTSSDRLPRLHRAVPSASLDKRYSIEFQLQVGSYHTPCRVSIFRIRGYTVRLPVKKKRPWITSFSTDRSIAFGCQQAVNEVHCIPAGIHLIGFSSDQPSFLPGRNRVTLVPHSGQVPFAIRRPFAETSSLPFETICFLRHFTQYPSNSISILHNWDREAL